MLKCRVVGEVWATKMVTQLENRKLILAAELDAENIETGQVIVAYDELGARSGDMVSVSFGSGARNTIIPVNNRHILCDAAVSMIIENETKSF